MTSPVLAVDRVLAELAIEDPQDLHQLDLIALARGAVVRFEPLTGAEARLTAVGRRAIITISTAVQNAQRRRFSIAHEVGHLEMHTQLRKVFVCTPGDIRDTNGQRTTDDLMEQEANAFAANLLMPARFFAPLCAGSDPDLEVIAELARTFDTSLTATAIRYSDLCDAACAVVYATQGSVKWYHTSPAFRELGLRLDTRGRLSPLTVATRCFDGEMTQALPRRVKAAAWLAGGPYPPQATLIEHAWAMPAYDAVLSLLWIDRDLQRTEPLHHQASLW